ncbi:helix-turn-helix domain-containing protein [Halobacillus salinus]|uniref:helix-turn-helix domain-containing protein n=1 Tax=Halobacillus salinus TaxID=192814 RepID=UPI0009A85BA8|nr:helix-turn-helix domain-containing protein [Halobacillus salinus]
MFDAILLHCVHQLRSERTISGIYHLLTGKLSSQTMQDAKAYQVEAFFGIHKSLSRDELSRHMERLSGKGLIVLNGQYASLTEEGKQLISERSFRFDGLAYHQHVPVLEKRLMLLVQTMTSLSTNEKSFVPIIDDRKVQAWVRGVYAQNRKVVKDFVKELHMELESILSTCSTVEANLLSYRLTGSGIIGLTYEQLAEKWNIHKDDVHVLLQHVFHILIRIVKGSANQYPVLKLCIEGLDASKLITESAKRTYYYVERGWTFEEIMEKRRLKKSTIQDHIVEVALVVPDFSIESFVSKEDQALIKDMAEALETKRLKDIFQGLNQRFSYFQIRLTLAHHQHQDKGGSLRGSIS